MRSLPSLLIALAAISTMAVGCSSSSPQGPTQERVSVPQEKLQQPAPAPTPQADPVIPPEAKNVPKPY